MFLLVLHRLGAAEVGSKVGVWEVDGEVVDVGGQGLEDGVGNEVGERHGEGARCRSAAVGAEDLLVASCEQAKAGEQLESADKPHRAP